MKIYSCLQMKAIEENGFNKGMSYIRMMENAGESCAEIILNEILKDITARICILCGKGKNGGDGFVIAEHLKNSGQNVTVVMTEGEPVAEEAAEMKRRLNGVLIVDMTNDYAAANKYAEESDIIIDCIFGIGFKGKITGVTAEYVEKVNSLGKCVISVDIPSGLNGDSHQADGVFIKADCTIAVTCLKPVHVLKPNAYNCGKIFVADIGIPDDCYGSFLFQCADMQYVKDRLIKRQSESNKGTYGKLMCLCGSRQMQGAAVLCSNAAVKSGAGLVVSAFPNKAYNAIAPKLTEPLLMPLDDDDDGFLDYNVENDVLEALKTCTAVTVGCGLGQTNAVKRIIYAMIKRAACPIVIDADGINVVSDNIYILDSAKTRIALTPHPGEMARLMDESVSYVQEDRIKAACEFAVDFNVCVVLKGNNTVIASPDGRCFVNTTGNAGLAKGGSGDVLAGIIGSFTAQGMDLFDACVCGAFIHGLCGDEVSKKYSMTGMTPSMLLDYLPELFSKFE